MLHEIACGTQRPCKETDGVNVYFTWWKAYYCGTNYECGDGDIADGGFAGGVWSGEIGEGGHLEWQK